MSDSLNMLPIINTTFFRSGKSSPRIYTPEIIDCTCRTVDHWTYEKVFNSLWGLYCIPPGSEAEALLYDPQGTPVSMESSKVYLIPSNTPFATKLQHKGVLFSINFNMHGTLGSAEHKLHILPSAFLLKNLPGLLGSTDPDGILLAIENIVCYYLAALNSIHIANFPDHRMDERVTFAVRYIERHLAERVSIRQICQELGISQMTLQRLFLRDIHKTPKQFQSDLRCQQAIHLLRHTEKTLDEIALELGFSNRCQFSNFFRKTRNGPPGKYRRSSRGRSFRENPDPETHSPEKSSSGKSTPDLEWKQFKTGKNMLAVTPYQYQSLDHELSPGTGGMEESSLWQILWTSGKNVKIHCGEKTISLPRKTCCLIPSRVRYKVTGRGVCRIFTATFTVCEDLELLERKLYFFPAEILRRILASLTVEKEDLRKQLLLQSMIFQYLARIDRKNFISGWKNLDPKILRSVQRIPGDLRRKLLIRDLARDVNMSINSFRILFKKETGMTPREFIHKERLLLVEKLLLHSDLNLSGIALQSGFADSFTLSKFFRRHKKLAPVQYRNRYRKKVSETF